MATLNRQVALTARPVGLPRVADFRLRYSALPSPGSGQVLVRSRYLSLDPHLRPRLNAAVSGGSHPIALDEVLPGAAVGEVVRSEDAAFRPGDLVEGMLGWQEYAVAGAAVLRRIDAGTLASTALGVLGLPGLTAYFGLLSVAEPRRGETVVVSGATGAVGMFAGQVARLAGCRVVGLASVAGDVSWLCDELGFDAALATAPARDLDGELAELCPDGVDVYFDNEGGHVTDAVVRRINPGARLSLCGQSSQDNLQSPELGPRWLDRLIGRGARMQGFLVADFAEHFAVARARLSGWLADGELSFREGVAQGLEAAPQAFIAMLRGESVGSQLVALLDSGVAAS